ncbi:MAG TPA: hypothetical protein DCY79_16385, partial [Planctomycetaceae bacterium]|nr:hypothetical protein [Planctomycetaceae bacterium]
PARITRGWESRDQRCDDNDAGGGESHSSTLMLDVSKKRCQQVTDPNAQVAGGLRERRRISRHLTWPHYRALTRNLQVK